MVGDLHIIRTVTTRKSSAVYLPVHSLLSVFMSGRMGVGKMNTDLTN